MCVHTHIYMYIYVCDRGTCRCHSALDRMLGRGGIFPREARQVALKKAEAEKRNLEAGSAAIDPDLAGVALNGRRSTGRSRRFVSGEQMFCFEHVHIKRVSSGMLRPFTHRFG